jgi:Family of unknown function (DUF5343)
MPVTADKPAPYATAGAILDLINRYRSRGLPSPIDSEVLGRVGIAQTLIARTLQSLHTLDLIDAKTGMPTPTFEALRLAPEADFKKQLEGWLKGAYADVFSFVDPSKDGEARIRDAFRTYQPVGQQERMVLLFQGLCAAAGLFPDKPQQPRTTSARPLVIRPRPAATVQAVRGLKKPASYGSGVVQPSIPPALAGLLASLPTNGDGWAKETRDKFMTTFGTVLDFCIPIVKVPPATSKESGGQT